MPDGRRLVLLAMCLLLAGLPSAWAKGPTVWVALSGEDTAGQEAVAALRRQLANAEVEVRPWREFVEQRAPTPALIVTVGTTALNRLNASDEAVPAKVPLVAMLVSRTALAKAAAASSRPLTGVYLDQPLERQLALLRLAVPGRDRIGVLLGPDSGRYRNAIGNAIRSGGLHESIALIDGAEQIAEGLRACLSDSDVLMTIPDAEIFSGNTARNILLAAYRHRVPVLGYSAAFVRAGALMAVYSTPEQIGRQAAGLAAEILAGRLPAAEEPQEFNVAVNANVARAFGLVLDEDRLAQQLRRERQP